ncbi:MAG: OmpA family protein [Acidobacteriota bacterium]
MRSIESNDRPTSLRSFQVAALVLVSSLILLPACVSSGKYKAALDDQSDLVDELDTVALQRDNLARERDALAQERDSLASERDVLATEKAALAREKEDLELDKVALERRAEELEAEGALLDAALGERSEELAEIQGTYEGLVKELESEVEAGQVTIEKLRDGVRVNLAQDILFETGSAELNKDGRAVLLRVSSQLEENPYQIMVIGYTDNLQIRGKLAQRYPTNWELGGARAASVVRLFESAEIASSRLLSVSYGENSPVASNDTPEGRQKNRRIEIRLRPVEVEE